jgi:hypothetical protein
MSGCSRPWHSPVAKYMPPNFSADSTGRVRNLLLSIPSVLGTHEEAKLGLATEILRSGGAIRLKAWGTSMLPSLWPGDLLTIQGRGYDEAVPGEIVLVLRDNRLFVHRLVEKRNQNPPSCITRGDAMLHNDPPAVASGLLGCVVGIHRANRSFVPNRRVSQLQSGLGWTLCRWDRFRNLTLLMHAVRLRVFGVRAGQFCSPFDASHQ